MPDSQRYHLKLCLFFNAENAINEFNSDTLLHMVKFFNKKMIDILLILMRQSF